MSDRIGALGITLNITSSAAHGTTVTGTIALSPMSEHHDAETQRATANQATRMGAPLSTLCNSVPALMA